MCLEKLKQLVIWVDIMTKSMAISRASIIINTETWLVSKPTTCVHFIAILAILHLLLWHFYYYYFPHHKQKAI
jgi:hypothetical protein